MLVLLLLSLELHISPNPIEGKVGERIPFNVRVLDKEGEILKGNLAFSVIPNSLGRVQGSFFVANKEGRGVLKCRSKINGKTATGFAYIRIGNTEKAKIIPSFVILKKGEQAKFTITGGTVREWKCIPSNIGNITNGVFTAKNAGNARVIAVLTDGEIKTSFVRVRGVINDIKISPRFKRVKIGEKIQFKLNISERVNWSIKGEKIGEISSSGLFTAKIPGKAVIIAENSGNEGYAIVIVSGEVGLRITPKSATLNSGEIVNFKVQAEGFGNKKIPVIWKVIPERCGSVRKDGTFIAGKVPTKGRVIAVLPKRFGKGIVSADVSIVPENLKNLELIPSFVNLGGEDINREFQFRVRGAEGIPLIWRVIPENLGTISNNGVFIPRRLGPGAIIVRPKAELNIKPGRAFIIVGDDNFSRIDTSEMYTADSKSLPPSYIDFSFPSQQVIEGFKIPLILNKSPADYRVAWRVVPPTAGSIILNREFKANKLPENVNQANVKIYAILYRGRQITAWASKEIKVIKMQ